VFGATSDPVKEGLVPSLNRPGGNVTRVNFLVGEVVAKRLQLLREVVPAARRAAFAAMHGPDLLYLICDPWPWG
jgi:putative ABC transport system substrate-binding protein